MTDQLYTRSPIQGSDNSQYILLNILNNIRMPPQTQGTTPQGHKRPSQVQAITHLQQHLQQLTTHSSVKEYTQKRTNNHHLLKANTKMI